ncbi:MAG: alkylation response protein AidB-like acyl-CoA dehydrogenase [Alphaproteobacteria bacterium]|jgi:alkylation response protein AidB-like acyl-CoA dehydrogenase
MYDLHLSEEQLAIRDTVRDFVANEITPIAIQPERLEPFDPPLPVDLIDKASELGLRTLALAEAEGGADADTLTCCLVAEELAAGDADVAAVLAQTAALAGLLFGRLMSPEQQGRFLPAFLDDKGYHLAYASREAGADTALGAAYHRPRAGGTALATNAVAGPNGDWVVNGAKTRVANAPVAKLFAVEAATDAGPVLLLVPHHAPGLSVREIDRDGGWYHGACGDVTFTDCVVPAENRLDGDVTGLPENSPIAQAANLGVARAAFEAALDYAKLRVQGGRPIVEHQAIGAKLAEVAINLEVARGAIWRAAWVADHPQARADGSLADLPHDAIAQVASAAMLYRAAKDAAECFGAMGVMRDMPLQKYIHDTRMFLHTGNGNDDAKFRIAEALAGFRPA